MNDLSGLTWDSTQSKSSVPRNGLQSQYSSFRAAPTPSLSRQPTPLSASQSGRSTPIPVAVPASKVPAQDSFANLLALNSVKKTNPLSLQERQKQLLEEKARLAGTQQKQNSTQYHADDSQFWEVLGSGRSTPSQTGSFTPGPSIRVTQSTSLDTCDDDDILAAFKSSAPVDASSHFPPPRGQNNGATHAPSREHSLRPNLSPQSTQRPHTSTAILETFDDDDDPFELGKIPQRGYTTEPFDINMGDDDILGELGRPVSKISQRPTTEVHNFHEPDAEARRPRARTNPQDAAIAELVDMGFAVEKSREALESTDTGVDVQAAVGWLLNQAHAETKSRTHTPFGQEREAASRGRPSRTNGEEEDGRVGGSMPAWLRPQAGLSRQDSQSPAGSDRDVSQYASEIGSSLFKSANSLWKTGQKRVQKVMAERQELDSGQPRWMRGGQSDTDFPPPRRQPQKAPVRAMAEATDEAMMLESGRSTPVLRPARQEQFSSRDEFAMPLRRQPSPLRRERDNAEETIQTRRPIPVQSAPQPRRQTPVQTVSRPVERISKQIIEEQSSEAYISPARRKKATSTKAAEPESSLDIFSSTPLTQIPTQPTPSQAKAAPKTTQHTQSVLSSRAIPTVSSMALAASTSDRQKGTDAFKRGDYAEAQSHYSNALSALPSTHPIIIILYSNRALTNIKTGDPKAAIADADAALAMIGPAKGDGELISLGQVEGEKPMKEFYGKALMRKAEALEHMEKWGDALVVWRIAVEAGVGGNVSIQGRNRCDKAAGGTSTVSAQAARPASAPVAKRPTPQPRRPLAAASSGLAASNGAEAEAVKRLRAANAAAAAASDEAFALNDVVSARLDAWKTGKEGNLRALLASLDTVLWEGAGWAKVGMADLVMPNRVKIVYMKAIAKCHPDKISQTATTEQRLVAAAVFASLNEGWDKFKRDNGM